MYLFRQATSHDIVYVGEAGPRAGSPGRGGIFGRFVMYRGGRSTGFAHKAHERALADPAFLEQQLARVRAGESTSPEEWAQQAIGWWDPEVCWVTTVDKESARALEAAVEVALDGGSLRNRRPRRAAHLP